MKEIEVEVAFDNSKEEVIRILSKYEYIGEKEIYDTYYYDPQRPNLKPEEDLRLNETFRVRKTDSSSYITYKKQQENYGFIPMNTKLVLAMQTQ